MAVSLSLLPGPGAVVPAVGLCSVQALRELAVTATHSQPVQLDVTQGRLCVRVGLGGERPS